MNSQALAKNIRSFSSAEPGRSFGLAEAAGVGAATPASQLGSQPPAQIGSGSAPEGAIVRFLHSFRVLLRSTRLYQRNHPRILESLEAAERNLRAALAVQSPVAVGVEGGRLVVPTLRGRTLPDPRGEFSSLAEELSRGGITSLVFLPETNQGELDHLSQILNESVQKTGNASPRGADAGSNEGGETNARLASPAARATDSARLALGDATAGGRKIRQDFPAAPRTAGPSVVAQFEGRRIAGIRLNAPLERRLDAALASLVAALLAYDGSTPGEANEPSAPQELPATAEELGATLSLLAESHRELEQGQRLPPQEAARSLHATLSEADRRTVSLLVSAASHHPPHQDELPESYLARLAEGFVLEYALQEFRAGRVFPSELRGLFARLGSLPLGEARRKIEGPEAARAVPTGAADSVVGTPSLFARWGDEAHAERLFERFWMELPAREKSRVLRSPEAWCVPVAALCRYVEKLIEAGPDAPAGASSREARLVLLNYASSLESEQKSARRAVAAGLMELHPLLERLWPHQLPEELSRRVLRTLEHENSPGIAGLLAATAENLARLALDQGDYDGFERILEALEVAPQGVEHAHLAALAKRLIADERWLGLVDAALFHWPRTSRGPEATRTLDAVLPRLLRRDPERLLDRLGLILTERRGPDALPAMARLLRAVGEPALHALEARLLDPRRQRAGAAIKLLATVQPERLAAALPRVLPTWAWRLQDLAISELARPAYQSLTPGTAHAFLTSLAVAHPMVVPMMLDQIGLAQGAEAVPLLIEIAAGEHQRLRDVFIRIKAVEALGRMRAAQATEILVGILERRQGLMHAEPSGLRAAAEEALALIENRPSSARVRATYEALEKASLSFSRPRRYLRIPLTSPLSAHIEGPSLSFARGASLASARVRTISLGGAFLESPGRLNVGDSIRVEIRVGLRSIHGTAVVRNISPNGGGIEFVHMPQEDREKLRRLVRKLQGS